MAEYNPTFRCSSEAVAALEAYHLEMRIGHVPTSAHERVPVSIEAMPFRFFLVQFADGQRRW